MVRRFRASLSLCSLLVWAACPLPGGMDAGSAPDRAAALDATVDLASGRDTTGTSDALTDDAPETDVGSQTSDGGLMDLPLGEAPFAEPWVHVSRTSAAVAWTTGDPAVGRRSYVEWGTTAGYGQRTPTTEAAYLNQLHHLRGLEETTTYHYRLVSLDDQGQAAFSQDQTFTTATPSGAQLLNPAGAGTTTLSEAGATYLLTGDISATGGAIRITGQGATLDLDGHEVLYATSTTERVHGIEVAAGSVRVLNGVVRQADGSNTFASYALGAFSGAADDSEVAGIEAHVNAHASYPLSFIPGTNNGNDRVHIHHNRMVSSVRTLDSRHYPGNDLIRLDTLTGASEIDHNLCLDGPHRGIKCSGGPAATVDIHHNDIAHDQGYVNGYAVVPCDHSRVHANRVVAQGRGIHLTKDDVEVFDNYLDLSVHMVYDDRPEGGDHWLHYYTWVHGIKLEEPGQDVVVHGNTVITTQPLPQPGGEQRYSGHIDGTVEESAGAGLTEDRSHWAPPTPLNFHGSPDANVEVYDNTFVAITLYDVTRNGPYYDAGEWAAALFIAGDAGASSPGQTAVYIHDNLFQSNDNLVGGGAFTQTLRIENNRFEFLADQATSDAIFFGGQVEGSIRDLLLANGNTFEGMQP